MFLSHQQFPADGRTDGQTGCEVEEGVDGVNAWMEKEEEGWKNGFEFLWGQTDDGKGRSHLDKGKGCLARSESASSAG